MSFLYEYGGMKIVYLKAKVQDKLYKVFIQTVKQFDKKKTLRFELILKHKNASKICHWVFNTS